MNGAHVWLAVGLAATGMAWWLGVELWRGRSQEHSARVFWLHLTAPLVAIVLMAAAIWLLAVNVRERVQRHSAPPASGSAARQKGERT